jgi:hypothetical protein
VFADGFTLVKETLDGAQLFLKRLKTAANSVGLAMKDSKAMKD